MRKASHSSPQNLNKKSFCFDGSNISDSDNRQCYDVSIISGGYPQEQAQLELVSPVGQANRV